MPSLFSIIGSSLEFFWKQPALKSVLFWFLFLPIFGVISVTRILLPAEQNAPAYQGMLPLTPRAMLLVAPVIFLFGLVTVWGIACTLQAGKRMLFSRAGRARTSFATLRKEAARYVVPLPFTGILRCLCGIPRLLFIVPGILYYIRTAFFPIIIVAEEKRYRKALSESVDLVSGHTWLAFSYLTGLGLFLFIPALLLSTVGMIAAVRFAPYLLILADAGIALFIGVALLLFLLSMILVFHIFRRLARRVEF